MATRFENWLKGNGYKPSPCDCGGPQYGTDHAPDCAFELSALDLQDRFDDEMIEQDADDLSDTVTDIASTSLKSLWDKETATQLPKARRFPG